MIILFSPDGRRLASASVGGTIKLWNIRPEGGEELNSLLTGTRSIGMMNLVPYPSP